MQCDDDSKHRSKSSRQLNFKNDHSEAVLQQLCWVSIYKESLQAVCKHQQSFRLSSCPSACHITSVISITEDGEKCALYVPLLKTHTCCPPFPAPLSLGSCHPFRGGRDTWPSSRTVWSRPQCTALWQVLWRMIIQLENQTKQMHTLAVSD